MLGKSPLPDTQRPGGSANPLGQLYSLPVIKFQSFIACDKIEARGWTHTFESRTCEIVYFVVA